MSIENQAREEFKIPLVGIRMPKEWLPWILAGFAALLILGWTFLSQLPATWFAEEGYYSHGILIPFMAAAVIWARRDKIASEPIGSSRWGLVVMVMAIAALLFSKVIDNLSLSALSFIFALAGGAYYAFGGKVGRHLIGPILFLVFMMPILGWAIDSFTNPLQLISTKVSAKLLNVVGYATDISPAQPTIVHLNTYTLNIGGPCSGFKLILSLIAFTAFFSMIASMGWKKNLLLFAITLPLAIFINGLRVMLVGVVGEAQATQVPLVSSFASMLSRGGERDAGMVFHDYSGYITLIICFVLLHYIVRALERKKQPNAASS